MASIGSAYRFAAFQFSLLVIVMEYTKSKLVENRARGIFVVQGHFSGLLKAFVFQSMI